MKDKVIIICKIHGDFEQTPKNHPRCGCSKCANNLRRTTEEFIDVCNKKHENKYSYIKTKYLNARTNLIITCLKHGDFKHVPYSHEKGAGCPKCGCLNSSLNQRSSLVDFIQKAYEKYGNWFAYSNVEYIDTHTPVQIICSEHGKFEQISYNHLKYKFGCKGCIGLCTNTEQFISKAKKYKYSNVEYIDTCTHYMQ